MIKVSVLYPGGEGKTFDMDYYCNKHIPLLKELVGPALKNVQVDHGLAGMVPGSNADFMAIGHLHFESLESFQANFGPHMPVLMGDIPNFTNATPVGQISEVKM